jgi:hypothetical protein
VRPMKVGDQIWTTNIAIDTGTGMVFYWIELPCNPDRLTAKQKRRISREFIETPIPLRHGPFNTEEECDADLRLVLFGPDCEVKDGGSWDPAWTLPQ